MSEPVTSRERDLLQALRRLRRQNGGISPTLDELAAALGLKSKTHIYRMVGRLVGKGHLKTDYAKARVLRVITSSKKWIVEDKRKSKPPDHQ